MKENEKKGQLSEPSDKKEPKKNLYAQIQSNNYAQFLTLGNQYSVCQNMTKTLDFHFNEQKKNAFWIRKTWQIH